jgi:hypothetical protein
MQQLALTADQVALVAAAPVASQVLNLNDEEALMEMPLTEAKRLAASDFERRYLVRVMGSSAS